MVSLSITNTPQSSIIFFQKYLIDNISSSVTVLLLCVSTYNNKTVTEQIFVVINILLVFLYITGGGIYILLVFPVIKHERYN